MEFTIKTKIKATAEEIYSAWLSSEGHSEMTGGEADISEEEGEEFTAWNGYISGENIALDRNKMIMQAWRTSEFDDDEEDSQLEVHLHEIDGETEVTLIHSNLPEDGEHYRKGWHEHYFDPMKKYFS